jgi:hypothetical protein
LGLLASIGHVRLASRAFGFLARDSGLLAPRIDLEELGALGHALSGLDDDLRDLAIDLGLHGRGSERLQRGNVLGRILNIRGLDLLEPYHGRRRTAAPPAAPPLPLVLTRRRAASRQREHDNDRMNHPWGAHASFDSREWGLDSDRKRECTTETWR